MPNPTDRAIAHLARIAVSHLDDGANGNITPELNAALWRLREELDKTNAGYAAAPAGAQGAVAWAVYSDAGRLVRLVHSEQERDSLIDRGPSGDLPIWTATPLYTHPQPATGDAENAARYRWLRDSVSEGVLDVLCRESNETLGGGVLDDAIDAARGAIPEQVPKQE